MARIAKPKTNVVTGAAKAPSARPTSSTIRRRVLQRFDLVELQQYTQEKTYATTASKDFHLFYVGRDDVHSIPNTCFRGLVSPYT